MTTLYAVLSKIFPEKKISRDLKKIIVRAKVKKNTK